MKVITWALSFLLSLMIFNIAGCPTCVGRMQRNDPPFFSKDFYDKLTAPYMQSQNQPGEDEEISHIEDAEDSGGDSEDLGEPL